ncbi:cytochrome P450 monooxygenase pc-1 [Coprinopsis sp. MPI-PUGE-AT-0042]|nr:cytochrome P450 monooxygenase pc-1 [Coprinopsis sp. MPI-PUGE-AT-0042]
MPSALPPGVKFLSRGVAYVAVYVGGAVGLARLADVLSEGHYYVPVWMAATGALAAMPVLTSLYIFAGELNKKRRAAALGARVVPEAGGFWPGNLDLLKMNLKNMAIGYPGDGLTEITAKQGHTFNFRVLWSDIMFTSCPEHIKAMLASDFQNYVKGERFVRNMESVLGTGVFNSDGDMWKFHRSITRPVFSRDRISDFDIFDHHTDTVIHKLKERLREGHAVDFQDLMARFTLDSATQFLFGHCVESLDAGLPYPHNAASYTTAAAQTQSAAGRRADEFARAFAEAQSAISIRERSGWVWPLFELFKDKTEEPMKIVNAYMEPIIKDAVERKRLALPEEKSDDKELKEGQTLLDHLMTVTQDPIVLRDEILNIMIAGRDTTAATLTFAIYLLARHPEVMKRLRAEVLERVGPSRRPDFDDLKELKYLRAVLNETLRLFPIVPFNVRETINETIWVSPDPTKKPLYIPPGTKTSYSVFLMHRRTDLWGPDAQEFDPDRFLDERLKKYLLKNSFIFLPFNAGPRICLGQQYAYNEMSFMMIRLMQNFSSLSLDLDSLPPDAHPPPHWAEDQGTRKATEKVWPKLHLTMYAHGGLWVKFQEANEA